MATATVNTREERKIIQQLVDVKTIHLELSEKEAAFLRFVLSCIGGSPTDSPRKFAVDIKRALTSDAYGWSALNIGCLDTRHGSMISFKSIEQYDYANELMKED